MQFGKFRRLSLLFIVLLFILQIILTFVTFFDQKKLCQEINDELLDVEYFVKVQRIMLALHIKRYYIKQLHEGKPKENEVLKNLNNIIELSLSDIQHLETDFSRSILSQKEVSKAYFDKTNGTEALPKAYSESRHPKLHIPYTSRQKTELVPLFELIFIQLPNICDTLSEIELEAESIVEKKNQQFYEKANLSLLQQTLKTQRAQLHKYLTDHDIVSEKIEELENAFSNLFSHIEKAYSKADLQIMAVVEQDALSLIKVMDDLLLDASTISKNILIGEKKAVRFRILTTILLTTLFFCTLTMLAILLFSKIKKLFQKARQAYELIEVVTQDLQNSRYNISVINNDASEVREITRFTEREARHIARLIQKIEQEAKTIEKTLSALPSDQKAHLSIISEKIRTFYSYAQEIYEHLHCTEDAFQSTIIKEKEQLENSEEIMQKLHKNISSVEGIKYIIDSIIKRI